MITQYLQSNESAGIQHLVQRKYTGIANRDKSENSSLSDRLRKSIISEDTTFSKLRLYKEIQIIIAGYMLSRGEVGESVACLDRSLKVCLDLCDQDEYAQIQNRIDAVKELVNKTQDKSGSFLDYKARLHDQAKAAVNSGDVIRMRNLLVQLAVLGENMGDKKATRYYRRQTRSIDKIYTIKGNPSITAKKIFRARFLHAIQQASLRHELAFQKSFADHVSMIQNILV